MIAAAHSAFKALFTTSDFFFFLIKQTKDTRSVWNDLFLKQTWKN